MGYGKDAIIMVSGIALVSCDYGYQSECYKCMLEHYMVEICVPMQERGE